MNEFETLEQYQNSIKEFNERTRLEFEDFIQKQGSDRNKLQLRSPHSQRKKVVMARLIWILDCKYGDTNNRRRMNWIGLLHLEINSSSSKVSDSIHKANRSHH